MTVFVTCPRSSAAEGLPDRKTRPRTFEVDGYYVEGNTVLLEEKLDEVFSKYTGPQIDAERVKSALAELQLAYREFGFVTVGVSLPTQTISNGIVRVVVTEGRLADIKIIGNRHFSSENIRRALPGLATNVLPNSKWLQPEIDRANQNSDRQIYPRIVPGPEPGTSALRLEVKDRLPLHGHLEFNNKATPATPDFRFDSALQYNNLWQLDHQLGIGYTFAPQSMKPDAYGWGFYDQPAVASYSGYYRIPFGAPKSMRETYEQMPVNFGYDEATHRFNLPSLTGSPELILYVSRSTSDTKPREGPISTITDTATLNVTSQTVERDPTSTANLGARFIAPLSEWHGVQSSFNTGFDFKSFRLQSLVTNYTIVQVFDTNTSPPTLITSSTVPNAQQGGNQAVYSPLSLGWSGSRADAWGSSSFGLSSSLYLAALSSSDSHIQTAAGSERAGGNFATFNFNLGREQNLPGGWSLLGRAAGQWSTKPLISNEQFAVGGVNSVRGYYEGDEHGDAGWTASVEARTPFLATQVASIDKFVPTWLRGTVFVDYGQRYLLFPSSGASRTRSLMGSGFGLSANINNHVEARVNVAWPVFNSANTRAGLPVAHFALGVQF